MNTIVDYINALKTQRNLLADILTEKGIEASRDEKFNTLIPKVNYIGGGGAIITGTTNIHSNNIYAVGLIVSNTKITGSVTVTQEV